MKKVTPVISTALALLLNGCAADKYHTQPGVHHYEHCKEIGPDVKRDVMIIECPLEK